VLLLAEDLVHHLDPAAVQRLLWNVGQYAPPGSMLLLDALAWPLARRLGPNGFGLRRSAELAAMHPAAAAGCGAPHLPPPQRLAPRGVAAVPGPVRRARRRRLRAGGRRMTGTVFDPPAAQPAPALLDRSGRWGLVPQADHAGHADGCCAVAACPAAGAGSRRRRLWDLDPHAHCPVVGLCLPVATLRRLMERHLASAPADDYELHGTGVGTCRTRNVFAEAVQRELDQRHAPQLRATRGLKTTAQLLAWWDLQRAGPHMAGALWAVLTHARCSSEAEDQVLGQVHMQQHEVGQMARALADRQQQLQAQLAQARRDQDQMAGRLDELRRQHAQERERLLAENLRLRGVVLAREALISQLDAERAALLQAQPDLPARQALAQQLREQGTPGSRPRSTTCPAGWSTSSPAPAACAEPHRTTRLWRWPRWCTGANRCWPLALRPCRPARWRGADTRHRFRVASHQELHRRGADEAARTGPAAAGRPRRPPRGAAAPAGGSAPRWRSCCRTAPAWCATGRCGQWMERRPFLTRPSCAPTWPTARRSTSTRASSIRTTATAAGAGHRASPAKPTPTGWRARSWPHRACTTRCPTCRRGAGRRLAAGHSAKWPLGRRLVIPAAMSTQALAAATGFVSTASDLARFFASLSPRRARACCRWPAGAR
jgi:hypothetical protein